MEYRFNYFEEKVISLLEEILRLILILVDNKQSSTTKTKTKTYDLVYKKSAYKYLLCTKEKLNKAIEEGVLVNKEHYITNGKRKWRFSKVALEPLRGKL